MSKQSRESILIALTWMGTVFLRWNNKAITNATDCLTVIMEILPIILEKGLITSNLVSSGSRGISVKLWEENPAITERCIFFSLFNKPHDIIVRQQGLMSSGFVPFDYIPQDTIVQ